MGCGEGGAVGGGALSLLLTVLAALTSCRTLAFEELPKFSQMKLLYPGYLLHGGAFRDKELYSLLGTNASHALAKVHNTASVRLSVALNRYSGRHAIGQQPVFLSKRGRDSFTGPDGQEYIFSNTAFGPFLASKYGDPVAVKPNKQHPEMTMESFKGKQGIVRLVSYRRRHPSGHIGLWDCDRFYQSRDWTMDTHIIAVEFWETSDSYCATTEVPPTPHLQKVNPDDLQIVARHNMKAPYMHEKAKTKSERIDDKLKFRHHRKKNVQETLWIQ